MNDRLRPGLRGQYVQRVDPQHLVSFLGPDVPGVLATPWMLMCMERAARDAVLEHLDAGHDTVGVGFAFRHLAA